MPKNVANPAILSEDLMGLRPTTMHENGAGAPLAAPWAGQAPRVWRDAE
ncbi:MAG: hypothetical protein ACRD3T_12465 [Terriglobia bacterium]